MKLTLYSKPGCHLCEELRKFLDTLQPKLGVVVEEVDITRDAELFARYRYEIPVLIADSDELGRGGVEERDTVARVQKWIEANKDLRRRGLRS